MGTFIAIANSILTTLSRGVRVFSGLLDEYGGAAAAYSVRRLSSDYATPTDSEFSFGGALQFDGVNDYVEFTPISLTDFTVNIWFNANLIAGASFRGLIGNSSSGNTYILLYNNNGTNSIRVSCGVVGSFFYNVPAFSLSTWNMLTVKRSGANVQVFFNGNESSTGALVINSNSISFNRLGSYSSVTNNFMFNGKQDEFSIYDTALSDADILSLYNGGLGDYATNYSPANLQAYWRANDGSGTTLTDEQGTYNGTLTNFDTNVCWVDGKVNKGALVEIRRSSDDLVKNFYYDSNNELSLNSKDWNGTTLSSWIGSDDGFVSTWYDQSGNAVNAQQTTPSLQAPIISAGSLLVDNGKPMVDFTGGDYYYNLSSPTTVLWSFGVQNVTAIDNIVNYIFGGSGEGCHVGGTTGSVTGWGMFTAAGSREANNEALGQNIRAWSGSKLFNNGVEERYSDTGNSGDFDLIMLGSRSDALAFSFTGYFQEAVFYNSNQEANVVGIQSNQNDYYSIYSPPSGIGTWAIGTTFVIQ